MSHGLVRNTRALIHSRQAVSDVVNKLTTRFYARGSRYLDPEGPRSRRSGSITSDGSSERQDVSAGEPKSAEERVPVKSLLENAADYREIPRRRNLGSATDVENLWNSEPYPKGTSVKNDQAKHSFRPTDRDPRDTSIILFPGQGTQYVGMGKDLLKYPNVRDMYDLASSILGYNLLQLCLEGPKNDLNQTVFCQPAVVVTSLAAVEKLRAENPQAVESSIATAGFSVGELAALTFAGALSFEDVIKLVKVRAEAMHLAAEMTPSSMVTVFYGPDSELKQACHLAREHCEKLGLEMVDCRVANYLYPHCKVIAGNEEAIKFIEQHAADFSLKRLKRLPVSGAFHTNLMNPAIPAFQAALRKVKISDPVIPVHSNVDGKRYKDFKHIARQLPKQITSPVMWEQTMHILYERNRNQDFPRTYECGPGSSLKSILHKVNAKAGALCTSIG